jgi:hypothetical protein
MAYGYQKVTSEILFTAYFRSGVNQMWILKNSKELLENIKSHVSKIDIIKTYDYFT